MKRLINNGDIFDKYASFEDKRIKDHKTVQFNWNGHRNIAGTYRGAAYSTSLADNYMANNLRNDSNPKGSLLVAAKNYTDQKVAAIGGGGSTKKLYKHTISAYSSNYGFVFITFYSYSDATIDSVAKLKTAVQSIGKITATGYIKSGSFTFNVYNVSIPSNEVDPYASGYRIEPTSGTTTSTSVKLDYNFNSIIDDVKVVS